MPHLNTQDILARNKLVERYGLLAVERAAPGLTSHSVGTGLTREQLRRCRLVLATGPRENSRRGKYSSTDKEFFRLWNRRASQGEYLVFEQVVGTAPAEDPEDPFWAVDGPSNFNPEPQEEVDPAGAGSNGSPPVQTESHAGQPNEPAPEPVEAEVVDPDVGPAKGSDGEVKTITHQVNGFELMQVTGSDEVRTSSEIVAQRLGYSGRKKVEELIYRNREFLKEFGELPTVGLSVKGSIIPRQTRMTLVNRDQLMYLVAKSEMPEANRMTVALIKAIRVLESRLAGQTQTSAIEVARHLSMELQDVRSDIRSIREQLDGSEGRILQGVNDSNDRLAGTLGSQMSSLGENLQSRFQSFLSSVRDALEVPVGTELAPLTVNSIATQTVRSFLVAIRTSLSPEITNLVSNLTRISECTEALAKCESDQTTSLGFLEGLVNRVEALLAR